MGWFFRKSVGFGPIRFNLSKSGIGASFGIKGARVSVGPKGTYVSLGRGGIYYRQKIGGTGPNHQQQYIPTPTEQEISPTELTEIKSATVDQLVDSSSAQFLQELTEKHQKTEFVNWGIGILIISFLSIALGTELPLLNSVFYVMPFSLGLIPLSSLDKKRKSITLNYDFDDSARETYDRLICAIKELKECRGFWRINAEGDSKDWKRNAGAGTLVKRSRAPMLESPPKFMTTNVEMFQIHCGDQKLCFLPERLLVYSGGLVGAVSYSNLTVSIETTRFIEDGIIPSDSEIVGHTWRFVNKNGHQTRDLTITNSYLSCFME